MPSTQFGPDWAADAASARAVFTASAKTLRKIATDRRLRDLIRSSPSLLTLLERAVWRFVAGPDRSAALRWTGELHGEGILSSIDYMGEDAEDPTEVDQAVQEFLALVEATSELRADASISVNLSHIGLAINRSLAVENCERILVAAEATRTEVLLNMEGDRYRNDILSIHRQLGSRYDSFGITLQACLEQTTRDLDRCLDIPGRIRLVKGAYDELGHGADIRNATVDSQFKRLAERLIRSDHACAIATHDPTLLASLVQQENSTGSSVEFEMLFGVATHRLRKLRELGQKVRVYLPYGPKWHLYFFHRLSEYPPNLQLALTDIVAAGRPVDSIPPSSPFGGSSRPAR